MKDHHVSIIKNIYLFIFRRKSICENGGCLSLFFWPGFVICKRMVLNMWGCVAVGIIYNPASCPVGLKMQRSKSEVGTWSSGAPVC
jgi:hypothetical protein